MRYGVLLVQAQRHTHQTLYVSRLKLLLPLALAAAGAAALPAAGLAPRDPAAGLRERL